MKTAILTLTAILALALASVASAKTAPPIAAKFAVPASAQRAFVKGFIQSSGFGITCQRSGKLIVCLTKATPHLWVVIFRPSACIIEARVAKDTGSISRDMAALNRNPIARLRQSICS